jgi:hypothetical protein
MAAEVADGGGGDGPRVDLRAGDEAVLAVEAGNLFALDLSAIAVRAVAVGLLDLAVEKPAL